MIKLNVDVEKEKKMKELFMIIGVVLLIASLLWIVIYPIYSKIKAKSFDWSTYALVMSICSVIINVFSLIIKMTN